MRPCARRNLPRKLGEEDTGELWELFGRFGAVRQIRLGSGPKTKGTAFVVYETLDAAYNAQKQLNAFKFGKNYLVALFFKAQRTKGRDVEKEKERLDKMKKQAGV